MNYSKSEKSTLRAHIQMALYITFFVGFASGIFFTVLVGYLT